MINVNDGQCGRCLHFGEHNSDETIVQIRVKGEAPEDYVNDCGHPALEALHLKVSANGMCDGFMAA